MSTKKHKLPQKSPLDPLKNKVIKVASEEAYIVHPDKKPLSLYCPISLELMTNPMITPEGFVYDEVNIKTHLEINPTDPQTRNPLNESQLVDFSELSCFIKVFYDRKRVYNQKKGDLINQARETAHKTPLDENPALFLCPASGTLMKNAIITAEGIVYDSESVKQGLVFNEKKVQLTLNDVVMFEEFQQQINLYNRYIKEQKNSAPPAPIQPKGFVHSFLKALSFAQAPDTPKDNNNCGPSSPAM